MKQDIYDYKTYLNQAVRFLKVVEDAEDAVQNALITFIKYKDTSLQVDWKCPEKTIRWLVKQACIRIQDRRRNISTVKTDHGRFIELDMLSNGQMMALEGKYFTFNEGEINYDRKVLEKNKDSLNSYFNIQSTEPLLILNRAEYTVKGRYIKNKGYIKKRKFEALRINGKYIKTIKE